MPATTEGSLFRIIFLVVGTDSGDPLDGHLKIKRASSITDQNPDLKKTPTDKKEVGRGAGGGRNRTSATVRERKDWKCVLTKMSYLGALKGAKAKDFPGIKIAYESEWKECIHGSTGVVNLDGMPISTRWSSEI
ncbi:hypothetical protein K1719_013244 [Acacia pycnantha]|nr:hypothetical protein K1719_013244 [Acacia pycnantha]